MPGLQLPCRDHSTTVGSPALLPDAPAQPDQIAGQKMKLLLDSRSPGDACLRCKIQEDWTARLMQLRDSMSEGICHMLDAYDALCTSVPHVTNCPTAH